MAGLRAGGQTSFGQVPIFRVNAQPRPSASEDPLETEADRVARRVMRARPASGSEAPAPPSTSPYPVSDADSGQPLPDAARTWLEPRFGCDFSRVRLHTNGAATRSADGVRARAYTVGNDIVFGHVARSLPGTERWTLLAHELVHVVQQSGGQAGGHLPISPTHRTVQRTPLDPQAERKVVGGPFVTMPDAPGVTVPARPTAAELVPLDDQDNAQTFSLPYAQIRDDPRYVDNGIISVGADLSNVLTLSISRLVFQYLDRHTVSVDPMDIDEANTARAEAFVRRGGVIYPVGQNGQPAYDRVNTPTIIVGARLVAEQQASLRSQNLQAAQLTMAFVIPIASLAGAAADLPDVEFGGTGSFRGRTEPFEPGAGGGSEPPGTAAGKATPRFAGTSTGDIAIDPDVGLARELRVAEEIGGRVAKVGKSDLKFTTPGGDTVKVDVLGPNQEVVIVGGPAKASKLAEEGGKLKRLKELADAHRVQALAYYEEGTPQTVLDLAAKWLGKANVHTFK